MFPAYAGMDRESELARHSSPDLDRVPRLRGDGPWAGQPTVCDLRHMVFPAYAGMDRLFRLLSDESDGGVACSPPTRGWTGLWHLRIGSKPDTVFPAYAGMDRGIQHAEGSSLFPAYAGMDGRRSRFRYASSVPRLRGDGPDGHRALVGPTTEVFPAYAGMDRLAWDGCHVLPDLACSPPTRGWTDMDLYEKPWSRPSVPRLRGDGPVGVRRDDLFFGACSPPTRGWTDFHRSTKIYRLVCSPPTRGWTDAPKQF